MAPPQKPKSPGNSNPSKFRLATPATPRALSSSATAADVQFIPPDKQQQDGRAMTQGAPSPSISAANLLEAKEATLTEFDSSRLVQPFLEGEEALGKLRDVRERLRGELGGQL